MADVCVIGGGVIGLSIAFELAGQGLSVTVLEQGRAGQEASWAGAGMLPPGCLSGAREPEAQLRSLSHSLWPEWTATLRELTGIDNGFLRSGALRLSFERGLKDMFAAWQNEGVTARLLNGKEAVELEPAISPEFVAAIHLPEQCQVRNPWHLKALLAGCLSRDVELLEGTPVIDWEPNRLDELQARTPQGPVDAKVFVVASGAWSQILLTQTGVETSIAPVRGQIALLRVRERQFSHMLEVGNRYLVPRGDGRILVGSTEERVGFVKQNTLRGIRGLLDFACSVVPSLADAELERCWSGLRPHPGRELPLIGALPGIRNVFVATGHFRSGLQMSPGTAVLVRQMLLGQKTEIPVDPFALTS